MAMQRGTRWQGSAIVNGERKRIAFSTRQEAERFEADPYAYLNLTKADHTIGEHWPKWARDLWGKTRNEKNALRITDEVISYLGPRTLITKIDREALRNLVVRLKERGNKDATINTKLNKISKLLSYAVDEKFIESAPKIKRFNVTEGRTRTLTKDEEERLINQLPIPYQHLMNFLLYTAARYGEAEALEWDDVDDTSVTFWRTKTDKPRTIPLTAKSKAALEHARANGWNRPFSGINYSMANKYWRKAREAEGLLGSKHVVMYALRHTCATRLARAGTDPLKIKKWLGHTDLKMTSRYVQLNVDDLRISAESLEK